MRRGRAAWGILVFACLAMSACGGNGSQASAPPESGTPQASATVAQSDPVLEQPCGASFTPNRHILPTRTWRRHAVKAGPVLMLYARRHGRLRVGSGTSLKIPALVEPETDVTISIDAASRADVGFADATNAEPSFDATYRAVRLKGCPAVSRDLRARPEVDGVAYPLRFVVRRARCVTLTVTAPGGADRRATISFGAGTCRGRT